MPDLATPTLRDPPGESPFHCKGQGWLASLNAYDKLVPGGAPAVIAAMPTEALRAYAGQRFSASAWYDLYPCCVADSVAAALKQQPFFDFMRTSAEVQARADFKGV